MGRDVLLSSVRSAPLGVIESRKGWNTITSCAINAQFDHCSECSDRVGRPIDIAMASQAGLANARAALRRWQL
jgi:hypothetical protein